MTQTLAPSMFISHGAPTFALEPGELGQRLSQWGQSLDGVEAIVAVSPHWQTPGLQVTSNPTPPTIHDFFGFAQALYAIAYHAPGSATIAKQVLDALESGGMPAQLTATQGMDHGVWVPLLHLRPQADIPVICVSLPIDATPASTWQLGQTLRPLRDQGILIMGTGSMTHNLAEFRATDQDATPPLPYVQAFTAWVQDRVQQRDVHALLQYRTLAPHARRAHPTEEHFLPLFVALGASKDRDTFNVLADEVRHGMLSMASYLWH